MIKKIVFIIILLRPDISYAYLDPGTGSIILLSIIGPLVGAGLAIKIYWQKIKMRFTK